MEFTCTAERRPGATILYVTGEVDVTKAPKLRDALIEEISSGVRHVVVELSQVEFMDSTGIGVLVGAKRRLDASGGRFNVVAPSTSVAKVLHLTGLYRAWQVAPTVADALGE
jgi:anti-sigma B factor antagonist